MNLALKAILFTSFVLVAVFGFTAMGHGAAHCIVSTMQGAACPENLLGFASFHIGFFKNFSSAIFDSFGFLALLLIFGFLFAAAALRGKFVQANPFFTKFAANNTDSSSVKKIRSWLSLLETSPTFSLAR